MSTKTWIGILLAGTAGILIFLFVHLNSDGGGSIQLGTAHAEACNKAKHGDCLPDVVYVDTDGVKYTPQTLAGKVVVVNFWATWCGPCQQELPDLAAAYEKYKTKGVVFLGVLTSDQIDDGALMNFRSDHQIGYPIVRASSDILVSFDYPQGLPTTFVFNRSGKRVYTRLGPVDSAALSSLLDQYSAEK